ncbi:MAG: hypothetical protein ACRED4_07045 [Brevundimonas sp.]
MPQALPAAVAWATAAFTSAATAVATTVIGAGASVGLSAATTASIWNATLMAGLSTAASAIMRPSTPSSGTTLDFKPDPKAPVRGAMGFTALGGSKVFQATWGYKRVAMSLGVALSLGPIDAITQFQADGSTVSFTGPQNEATGFYAADMWQKTTLGLPTDAALLPPTGLKYGNPPLTGWGASNAAPQTAFAFWTMVLAKNPEDRDIFTNGVPDPRWVGRWMKVWNPRRDDTYPGGSGPQRRDDWRTWEWSENPYVHALAWVRGHFKLNTDGTIDRTKRIAGVGAPDAAIDIPGFVEGMNVADANAWTISGEWSTSDGKWQTLVAMLQAGGGQPINRGAQISVLVNAPRVSTYTFTKADLVGQAAIKPLTPRRDRKNTIIPRYRSQANGWEYVAAGEVTSSTYRDEDRGEPRTTEVEYVHVRNAKQAGQLAAYDLVNLREGLTATLPSKVHMMHIHAGDCITVEEPELAMESQKFVVLRTRMDHATAVVTLEVRSETDAKHAFALGQTDKAPPSPTLSAVDPKYMDPPDAGDWTSAPKPPSGGTSQPIIIIGGKVETADVASVIIEHGPSNVGPWTLVYAGAPSIDGKYEAKGLTPGQQYWVSIRYVAKNGAISDRLIDGPRTAGDLIAGDTVNVGGEPAAQVLAQLATAEGLAASTAARVDDLEIVVEDTQGEFNQALVLAEQYAEASEDAATASDARATAAEGAMGQALTYAGQASDARDDAVIARIDAETAATNADAAAATVLAQASEVSDDAASASLSAQIAVSLGTGAGLHLDPTFQNWPAANPLPTGVTGIGSSYTITRQTTGLIYGDKALRFVKTSGGDVTAGLEFTAARHAPPDASTAWVVDYQVTLNSGSFAAASFYVRTDFASGYNANYVGLYAQHGLGTVGQTYRGSKFIRSAYGGATTGAPTANTSRFYGQFSGVPGNGASGAKDITVHLFQWRPATQAEIEANEAIPDLEAQAAILAGATADLQDQVGSAFIRLIAASGGNPALVEIASGPGGTAIKQLADKIYFGANTVFDDATDTLITTYPNLRYITAWGGPFGANSLTYWVGPPSVSPATATKANAEAAGGQWRDSTGDSFFGGKTLSGPFDSGVGSATDIALTASYQTIATVTSKQVRNGFFNFWPEFMANGSGELAGTNNYRMWIGWQVISVNQANGDSEVIASGTSQRAQVGSSIFADQIYAPPMEPGTSTPGTKTGNRKLLLQARAIYGQPFVSHGRLRGFYSA